MTGQDKNALADLIARIPLQDIIARETGVRFRQNGNRYIGLCPFHREKTPSFTVFTSGKPRYQCFGASCQAKGNIITFLQKWKRLSYRDAVFMAAELVDMSPGELGNIGSYESSNADIRSEDLAWPHQPMGPEIRIPEPYDHLLVHNSSTGVTYWCQPTKVHVYRDRDGQTLMLVLRFDQNDGGKYFHQVIWRPGPLRSYPAIKGCWMQLEFAPGMARPLYGAHDIDEWEQSNGNSLLLVEGEKTRDSVADLLDMDSTGVLALSNVGSSAGINKTDLKPVVEVIERMAQSTRTVEINIWPDADDLPDAGNPSTPGDAVPFVDNWNRILHDTFEHAGIDTSQITIRQVTPPQDRKHGWDLADAADEGWSDLMVLDWMTDNSNELLAT